ncbi:MAG: 50S ribosomal protein L18e [Candidatus Woesearchaeota archaeon]
MTLEHKNEKLKALISSLKKQSIEQKTNLWKRIALELERPTRQHRIVNLSKIDKYSNDNDVIIIPGKLLSGGQLSKKITIVAYSYSRSVVEKVGGKASILSIEEAMKKYPKGNNLKIIG